MKIISFVNRKGGCGKSSLVCLLALYWAERGGKSVAISDLDPQGSSGAFVEHIGHQNISAYDDAAEYDYVLIDTPGGIEKGDLSTVVSVSDLIVIPLSLSPTDIRSSAETADIVAAPSKSRLLFNQVNVRTNAFKGRGETAEAIGLEPLESYLGHRVAYAYALVDGWRALRSKSVAELKQLAEEIG